MPNTAILVTKMFDYHGNGMEVIDFCPRYTSYNRVYRQALIFLFKTNLINKILQTKHFSEDSASTPWNSSLEN